MNPSLILEVCIDSLDSARAAISGGANRLEICSCLAVGGGLTPSFGLVQLILQEFPGFPTMIMIRPRMGDFLYSNDEFNVMKQDIQCFKSLPITGFVFGLLTASAEVDVPRTQELASLALASENKLEVTFHRAFDMTKDAQKAYHDLTGLGITRILTSGLETTTPKGLSCIRQLIALSEQGGPRILPGSGINSQTIQLILRDLWQSVHEYHLSGGGFAESMMETSARRSEMGMGVGAAEWGVWTTSEEKVREVRTVAENYVVSHRPDLSS